MAEWSNATDSRSVPFGGAGSNPAGHISRKVYSNYLSIFSRWSQVQILHSGSLGLAQW